MSEERTDKDLEAVQELTETPLSVAPSEPVENAAADTEGEQAEEQMSMAEAMAAMETASDKGKGGLTRGSVVEGVVVHIDNDSILVDIGTKSEGIIRRGELSTDPSANPEDVASVGEKIRVIVLQQESQEGGPVLSKKRADFMNAWDKVELAFQSKETIKAMVTERVKGGLVVDLGVRGFVPASHLSGGKMKNLDKFVGQSLPFKVIELDRERRKVVLSNRLAVEEEREAARKVTWEALAEGQIRDGVIRRITDYGAFVDLGGVDGLLHVSEMSWTRIGHPSEVVKVGEKLQVVVLKINKEQNRVSLGLRQILPDPWENIRKKYLPGDTLNVKVTRLAPSGAFVELSGVEAFIPNSELSQKRISKPEEVISIGDEVEAKVLDVRPEERRMTLSVRQIMQQKQRDQEHTEYQSYQKSNQQTGTTIGDMLGAGLGDLVSSFASEPEAEEEESAADLEPVPTDPAGAIAEASCDPAEAPEAEAEPAEQAEEVVETAEPAAVDEAVETADSASTAEAETVDAPVEEEAVTESCLVDPETETVVCEPTEEAPKTSRRAKKESEPKEE